MNDNILGGTISEDEARGDAISNEKQWRCPNCQGVHPIKDARIVNVETLDCGTPFAYMTKPLGLRLEIKHEGDQWTTRYPIAGVVCSECGRVEFFADMRDFPS